MRIELIKGQVAGQSAVHIYTILITRNIFEDLRNGSNIQSPSRIFKTNLVKILKKSSGALVFKITCYKQKYYKLKLVEIVIFIIMIVIVNFIVLRLHKQLFQFLIFSCINCISRIRVRYNSQSMTNIRLLGQKSINSIFYFYLIIIENDFIHIQIVKLSIDSFH